MNLVSLFLVMMENHLEFGTWESRSAPNNYLYSHACAASFAQNLVTCPSLCFFWENKESQSSVSEKACSFLMKSCIYVCVCVYGFGHCFTRWTSIVVQFRAYDMRSRSVRILTLLYIIRVGIVKHESDWYHDGVIRRIYMCKYI